jgi:hypothetical protein
VSEINPTGLLFWMVLALSVKRSKKKLKTCLLSLAVLFVVSFMVLLLILFLPAGSTRAVGPLAADTGNFAGILTAIFYSSKTREITPRSIYLLAIVCVIFSVVSLVLENF